MLIALAEEGPAGFRADQRLRRTFAVGDVRHVQIVTLDLLVQMLTAIYSVSPNSFLDHLTAEAQRRGGSPILIAPRLRVSAVVGNFFW